jgi:hypothetical protein
MRSSHFCKPATARRSCYCTASGRPPSPFAHQLDGLSADFRVIAGHALYLEKPQAFNRLVRDLAMQHTGSIGVGDPID